MQSKILFSQLPECHKKEKNSNSSIPHFGDFVLTKTQCVHSDAIVKSSMFRELEVASLCHSNVYKININWHILDWKIHSMSLMSGIHVPSLFVF